MLISALANAEELPVFYPGIVLLKHKLGVDT